MLRLGYVPSRSAHCDKIDRKRTGNDGHGFCSFADLKRLGRGCDLLSLIEKIGRSNNDP